MRMMMVLPFLFSLPAIAQDAGQIAVQQSNMAAAEAAQQANDQAMQASQQASMSAQNAAAMAAANNGGLPLGLKPKFSVKAGTYSGPLTVRITDSMRHAAIYYTTNGWTPTTQSARYVGPIPIDASTRLQAIAVAPYTLTSQVSEADYVLPVSAKPDTVVLAQDGVLHQGTAVPLVFAADLDSKTAQVGDHFPLKLASEIKIGDRVIAAGTIQGWGRVTAVDRPGIGGFPGEISFAVDSLMVGGVTVPLKGGETEAGQDRFSARNLALIPGMEWSVFRHGKDAAIHSGALVTATVTKDSVLPAL